MKSEGVVLADSLKVIKFNSNPLKSTHQDLHIFTGDQNQSFRNVEDSVQKRIEKKIKFIPFFFKKNVKNKPLKTYTCEFILEIIKLKTPQLFLNNDFSLQIIAKLLYLIIDTIISYQVALLLAGPRNVLIL